MTISNTSQSTARPHFRNAIVTVAAIVPSWFALARRVHRTARDIRAVQAMSDRMLNDIGLARGGIDFTVRNGRLQDH